MKILNYRRQPQGSFNLALFDVYIPALDVTWHNFRLVQSKKGHKFVQSAAFGVDGPDGKKIWKPIISFGEHRGKEFNQQCLKLLQEFENGPTPHTTSESLFN